jgi:hypothetical protein
MNTTEPVKQQSPSEDRLSLWLLFVAILAFVVAPGFYPGLLRNLLFWSMQLLILGMGNGIWLSLLICILVLRIPPISLQAQVPRIVPIKLEPGPKVILALFAQALCWYNFLSQTPNAMSWRAVMLISVFWTFPPFSAMRLLRKKRDKHDDQES